MNEITILQPERVTRTPPENMRPGDEQLFHHELVKDIAETRVLYIRDVTLLPNGFLLSGLRVRPESFHNPHDVRRSARKWARAMWHLAGAGRITRLERGLLITDEFSNGYFHWICDVLPRLESLTSEEPRSRTIAVPAMAVFPYVAPSLEPFGVPPARLMSRDERVSCADLLVVTQAAPTGNYRPSLMGSLRLRFRNHFECGPPRRRVYVSRARASRRKVTNEEEVLAVLSKHGFERVVLEELTLAEQVRLAGEATIMIGNHGAGLANIAWMTPGTTVLELRLRGDRLNNCYFSLASSLGIRYRYLECAGAGNADPHFADVIVDARELEREMQAMNRLEGS